MMVASKCRRRAQSALAYLRVVLDDGERQLRRGAFRDAMRALGQVRNRLGWLDALNFACGLGARELIDSYTSQTNVLEERIGQTCEKPGLAGIDPYDAYRKLRKPLPPQKGGPHKGKKGKKGYDRKRDKQRSRREE